MVKKIDTFFERYAYGTISSPVAVASKEIIEWFAEQSIIAGVWSTDKENYEFIVPIDTDSAEFIGTVAEAGGMEYTLLVEQMTVLLARKFSADVTILEEAVYDADWSNTKDEAHDASKPTYIISRAAPESAMMAAYALKQSIEYGSAESTTIWRLREDAGWFEYPMSAHDLPMFIFTDNAITVRYKTMSDPVLLTREGEFNVSLPGDTYLHLDDTPAGKAYEELKNFRIRPGSDIDMLRRSGAIDDSQVDELIKIIESSDNDEEFIAGVGNIFNLSKAVLGYVLNGTMPDNTRTVKAPKLWKLFVKSAEEYSFEPDPNAGPIKRAYAYISERPLFDWAFMTGEVVLGVVLIVLAFLRGAEAGMKWWHYGLMIAGVMFIIEGVVSVVIRIRRNSK